MTRSAIAERRLRNQRLTSAGAKQPEDVVEWFGVVQAQEFEPALWGLGLRMASATASSVEQAFNDGRILRTHILRPTWHFVSPADIRWMQGLTADHVRRRMAPYDRQLGLDARTHSRSLNVIERVLGPGTPLTRAALGVHLTRAGIAINSSRLAHIMMNAELECLVCSGPRIGRQFTYALVSQRAPTGSVLPRDEALSKLVHRFFRSHGPATVRDCVWWSGLPTADVRRGLDMIRARRESVDDVEYWTPGQLTARASRAYGAHLLPIYDEYLVAYRDRAAVPHRPSKVKLSPSWVTFQHAVVIDGQVAGTWRLHKRRSGAVVVPTTLRRLSAAERRLMAEAIERHHRFGMPQ
jgi:hypothetical protein